LSRNPVLCADEDLHGRRGSVPERSTHLWFWSVTRSGQMKPGDRVIGSLAMIRQTVSRLIFSRRAVALST